MAEKLNVQFTCPLCGGHDLSLPEGYTDSSIAECASCGSQIGTWGQLKALAGGGASNEPAKFKGLSSLKGTPSSR